MKDWNYTRSVFGCVIFTILLIAIIYEYTSVYIAAEIMLLTVAIIIFYNSQNSNDNKDNKFRIFILAILLSVSTLLYTRELKKSDDMVFDIMYKCYENARSYKISMNICKEFEEVLGDNYLYNVILPKAEHKNKIIKEYNESIK